MKDYEKRIQECRKRILAHEIEIAKVRDEIKTILFATSKERLGELLQNLPRPHRLDQQKLQTVHDGEVADGISDRTMNYLDHHDIAVSGIATREENELWVWNRVRLKDTSLT